MTRGILHRHEDGREHRHTHAFTFTGVGNETVGQVWDGSQEHNHGFLSDPGTSGPVVWREGAPNKKVDQ